VTDMDGTTVLQGRRILVVEDDFLVAQVLMEMLEDAGAIVLGPIGWVSEALAFLERDDDPFDTAVLDINLHGEKSFRIADVLAARRVRIVFATGYGAGAVEQAYSRYPRCEKPFNQETLLAALAPAG